MAFARAAIRRRNLDHDAALVGELCTLEGADRVVIGLPLNIDGSEGAEAGRARAFGDRLELIGIEVAYEDERLTSWEAGERLAAEGRRPHRRSGELDSAAARLILQQYLDARRSPADSTPAPDLTEETE